jgi:hypothetical protein
MMGRQHIEAITQNYSGDKDICDIKVTHNEERPVWIVLRAMGKLNGMVR